MKIQLSPVFFMGPALTVYKQGDSLTINGLTLDFGRLPEGATLPAAATGSPWLIAPVERIQGELVLTLLLPIPDDADHAARYPADIMAPADGKVLLPVPDASEQAPAQGYAAIDWDQVVTSEDKAQEEAEQLRVSAIAEAAQQRKLADAAIAPLQDAVDLDEATEDEISLLKKWKYYRLALNRLPNQAHYPVSIDWPLAPTTN